MSRTTQVLAREDCTIPAVAEDVTGYALGGDRGQVPLEVPGVGLGGSPVDALRALAAVLVVAPGQARRAGGGSLGVLVAVALALEPVVGVEDCRDARGEAERAGRGGGGAAVGLADAVAENGLLAG